MKSLDFKSIMIIAVLCTTILLPAFLNANCDMMAMIAKEGHYISWQNTSGGSFDDPYDFFDFIRVRSRNTYPKPNNDGYGFCYYPEDGTFDTENQTWYQKDDYPLVFSNQQYPYETYYTEDIWDPYWIEEWQDSLDTAEDTIMYNNTKASIVLGHARQGSTGEGNHPFYFVYGDTGDTTYTFMHNGTIDNTFKISIMLFLQDLVISGDPWFDLYHSNWLGTAAATAGINDFIDSELYFHYIVYYILAADGNVAQGLSEGDLIQGLYNAINETAFEYQSGSYYPVQSSLRNPSDEANFVLSDGTNLYAFRNTTISMEEHCLGFYENNSFVGIRTYGHGDFDHEIKRYELAVFTPYGYPHGFDEAYNPTRITNFLLPDDDYQPLVFKKGSITQDLDHPVDNEGEPRLWFTSDITIETDIDIVDGTEVGVLDHITIEIDDAILTIEDDAALHLNHASTVLIDDDGAELFLDWGSTITGCTPTTYEATPPGQPAGAEEAIPGDRIIAQYGGIITTGDIQAYENHPGYPNNVTEAIISSSSEELWDGIFIQTPDNGIDYWFVNCDISWIRKLSIENISESEDIANLNLHFTDFHDAGQIVVRDGHELTIEGSATQGYCYLQDNTFCPIYAYESPVFLDSVWVGGDGNGNNGTGIYLYDSSRNLSMINNCNFLFNNGDGVKLNGVAFSEFNYNHIEDNTGFGMVCFLGTIFDYEQFIVDTLRNNGYAEYAGYQNTFRMDNPEANIGIEDDNYGSGSDQYLLANLNWDQETAVDISGTDLEEEEDLEHLFPNPDPPAVAWIFGRGRDVSEERLMLYSASSDMGNGNYTAAEQTLQQIISGYPLTQEAGSAVYYLYHLENLFEQDFPDLRNYLENIYVVADTPLEKAAEKIITKSYMKDNDYLTAIDRLEYVINNSQIPDDVILAMIDEGYCYMELAEGGERALPTNCTIKTSTLDEYQARVRELESQFSFYPEEQYPNTTPVAGNILSLTNYPNPFNPSTTISFDLASECDVSLTVYNIKGQKVTKLIDKHFENGSHTLTWNGKDSNNKSVSSGIYFYKFSAGKSSATKKMLLLK